MPIKATVCEPLSHIGATSAAGAWSNKDIDECRHNPSEYVMSSKICVGMHFSGGSVMR
jgi:hypothetical protein